MIIRTNFSERIILIHEPVFQVIGRHAFSETIKTEAGGILIGSFRGKHLDVVVATEPLKADIRAAHFFDRMDPGHQKIAKKYWDKSNHTLTFVGEWHTHDQDYPTPSFIDWRTWREVAARQLPYPALFLIQGRKGIWCGLGDRGKIKKLNSD